MGFIKKYFFNKEEFAEKDVAFAKKGFIVENAAYSTVANLITGTYKVGFLACLGATEAETSFIMSLLPLAGLSMIFVPAITKNMTFKKPFIFICRFLDKFLSSVLFLLPFIFGIRRSTVAIIGVVVFAAYLFSQIGYPVYNEWFMNCLSKEKKIGRYNSVRIAVLHGISMITSFVAAQIMGAYTGDNELFGYMWLSVIAFVITVIQMSALFFIKEPYIEKTEKKPEEGILKSFKAMFKCKQLLPYLKFLIVYQFGSYLISGLTNILCVQRIGMPVHFITYLTTFGLLIRILLARFLGKLTDKIGGRAASAAGYFILGISYMFYIFMTPENAFVLKICAELLFTVAWGFIDVAAVSLQLEFIPEENRSSYIACYTALLMALATVSGWITTWIVSAFNNFKVTVLGFTFNEMNILFVIGSLIICVSATMLLFARKQKC